ncbi:MAG: hypothetical protein QXJ19_07230 [Candidatus Bathyarchaeia archaeon]|nr:hypothetical protein [Candidatus Bathyarchaeota archaeon]
MVKYGLMKIKSRLHPIALFIYIMFFVILPLGGRYCFSLFGEDRDEIKFYAFSDPYCFGCIEILNSLPSDPVVYDVRVNSDRYIKIIGITNYTALSLPLIGVIKNGNLTLIASGYFSPNEWKKILGVKYCGVPIYISGSTEPVKVIRDESLIHSLNNIFVGSEYESDGEIFSSAIPITNIIIAALLDSFNPCEIYTLIVLLSLALSKAERRDVLKVGLAFSLGIFISYFLLGFGFINFLEFIIGARYIVEIVGVSVSLRTIINLIFGFLGLSLGLREAINSMFKKSIKRLPRALSTKLSAHLRRAFSNPLTSLVIGVLSGLLLSPCTSGPYFIALAFITNIQYSFLRLLLLFIYNMIFILPTVVITLGIYLKFSTKSIKIFLQNYQRILNLVIGLLLIFLSTHLLIVQT